MAKEYQLIRSIGVFGGTAGATTKELNIVQWGSAAPMLDIRKWRNGEPGKGISVNDWELQKFLALLYAEYPADEGSSVAPNMAK